MDQDFTVVQTDDAGKELIAHGTPLFPLHNVFDDFSILDTVAWHWHVEFEMGIVLRGKLQLAVHTEKYDLDQGDGFFINSEVLHHFTCLSGLPFPTAMQQAEFPSIRALWLMPPHFRTHYRV